MMDHMQARRRGGSFHHDEGGEEKDVQFVTPYYEGHGPEPLDLSKLRLENMGPEDNDSSDEEEDEEELYTRGRSRSRSVHANDQDGSTYVANDREGNSGPPELQSEHSDDASKNGAGKVERTGPLQHREVIALQKVSVPPHIPHTRSACYCRDQSRTLRLAEFAVLTTPLPS